MYGDSNTIWFHSRASMKRASNAIDKIRDEQGYMHEIGGFPRWW